ncbi:MAG: DUF432 domain-containing protein [Myxococcales bacterium]|nr:DUF432 domain-containing protein [Myxococcales bacterium]
MRTVTLSVFQEDYEFHDTDRVEFPMFDESFIVERLGPSSLRFVRKSGEQVRADSIISVDVRRAAFTFDPRLLDRPVILSFNARVIVHPKTSVSLYLLVPLDLSLVLKSNGERIPVGNMIGEDFLTSCFGPPEFGQVCYIYYSEVLWKETELGEASSFFAVVPLTIDNVSRGSVEVAKIILEPWLLDLFEHDGRIYTSAVQFRVVSRHSGTLIYRKAPPHSGDRPLMCSRTRPPKSWKERLLPWTARRRGIHYFKD